MDTIYIYTHTHTHTHTQREREREMDGWMNGRTDGWTDGRTDRQTDRQIDIKHLTIKESSNEHITFNIYGDRTLTSPPSCDVILCLRTLTPLLWSFSRYFFSRMSTRCSSSFSSVSTTDGPATSANVHSVKRASTSGNPRAATII